MQTPTDNIPFSKEELRYRYIEPAFITPDECAKLVDLLEKYGKIGEG
jgi:hypothetical protein